MIITAEYFKGYTFKINVLDCTKIRIEAEIDFYRNTIFYNVIERYEMGVDEKLKIFDKKLHICNTLKDAFDLVDKLQLENGEDYERTTKEETP